MPWGVLWGFGGSYALLQPLKDNGRLLWSRQAALPPPKTDDPSEQSSLGGSEMRRQSRSAAVLSVFCVYTAFLAWTGPTEASLCLRRGFVAGAYSNRHLAVVHYGTVGLVAANCLAMLARAFYSLQFATKYFRKRWQASSKTNTTADMIRIHLLRRMFPHPLVLVCFATSFGVTRISQTRFQAHANGRRKNG
jgi:hypothetical protein